MNRRRNTDTAPSGRRKTFTERQKEIRERLATPIVLSDEPDDDERKRTALEREERMALLFERHGFKYGEWESLARVLAVLHEPGLRLVRPAGVQVKWDFLKVSRFKLAVEAEMRKTPRFSQADAARRVATREEWLTVFGRSKDKPPTDNAIAKVLQKHTALLAEEVRRQEQAETEGFMMIFGALPNSDEA